MVLPAGAREHLQTPAGLATLLYFIARDDEACDELHRQLVEWGVSSETWHDALVLVRQARGEDRSQRYAVACAGPTD